MISKNMNHCDIHLKLIKYCTSTVFFFKKLQAIKLNHPNISLWHIYYFDLKTIKTEKTQKETLTFSLTAQKGLPRWCSGIESTYKCRSCKSHGFHPWNSPKGNGNPLQYSCLEKSMDRRAWQATVHGFKKNQT